MQDQKQLTVAGQAVAQEDLNSAFKNAALAEDHAAAILAQISNEGGGGFVGKKIIPTHDNAFLSLVSPAGVNAKVTVQPFWAYIGSRDTDFAGWRYDVRIGHYDPLANTDLSITPTVANNRWDLVYAKIDIDVNAPAVQRVVKATDGTVSQQGLTVTKRCLVTVAIVQGAEATTPVRPSLPSDAGNSFYIPIAYMFLKHSFTSGEQLPRADLHEVAPIFREGFSHAQPAEELFAAGGTVLTQDPNTWKDNERPPTAYLPSTMVGQETRYIPLNFPASGTPTIPLNATTVLDQSIDWKNRIFDWVAQVRAAEFAWSEAGSTCVPSGVFSMTGLGAGGGVHGMGQSFRDGGDLAAGEASVARLSSAVGLAASSTVNIFVDSDGQLKAKVSSTNPAVRIVMVLRASGRFPNAHRALT